MRCLAAVALVAFASGSALATTGLPDELALLCYDAGDASLRWVIGEPNGGYVAYERRAGESRARIGTDPGSAQRLARLGPLHPSRCAPLSTVVDLSRAGWVATVRPEGEVLTEFEGPDGLIRPLAAVARPRCRHEIAVESGGRVVARALIDPCCGSRDFRVQGFLPPTGRDLALVVTFVGKCFERGYETREVIVAPGVEVAGEHVLAVSAWDQASREDEGRELRVSAAPFGFDYARLLGDAGFRAYQQGSLAVAIEYLEHAYQASRASIPDLEALFNLAAAQSKAGDAGAAIMNLRMLFSFSGQRARFLARVRRDRDFDPMRDDAVFREVLAPESCCQWTEAVEVQADCWLDHCPEGGVRKQTVSSLAFRDGERRIVERTVRIDGELREMHEDDGEFVSKYANGQERERGRLVGGARHGTWMMWSAAGAKINRVEYVAGNKHGIETEWFPSGELRAERTWRAGELHGRAIDWYPSGAKRSELFYSADERHGPVARWFEDGRKELAGSYERDHPEDIWSTWSAGDGSLVRLEVYQAGVVRFRCEYTFFDGELRDARRCNGTYFHGNGKRAASGVVLDGRPTGAWQRWSQSGARERNAAPPDDRPLSRAR